ncbi:MAG: glucose 1-dehydrogenase [Rhodobiaceae bacterium]|nr:glucose 1-dehydrogenase [Rhodobiaceae bacterium]
MRLQGKIAIVTGAGSGFGAEMARRFGAEGAHVAVADIDAASAEKVAAEVHGASAFQCDVSDSASVKALVAAVGERFGDPDIVVNNAGTTHQRGDMLAVDEATFDRVMAVNVKSIYLMAIHAVPHMKKGASILNIASTAGVRPRPGLTWYNGTKGAVITLTKSMAVELAPRGIRVNALNPVVGETGLTAMFLGEDTPEMREAFRSTIPLGRFSTPRDIANAAVFLSSDEAEFLTGVCMEVDGGRCI